VCYDKYPGAVQTQVQTPSETGAFFLFTEATVHNLPLFIGYAALIVGIVLAVAGNRKALLERVRHQDKDER
jgi:hypothetical protein